jgi:hypothetical protein
VKNAIASIINPTKMRSIGIIKGESKVPIKIVAPAVLKSLWFNAIDKSINAFSKSTAAYIDATYITTTATTSQNVLLPDTAEIPANNIDAMLDAKRIIPHLEPNWNMCGLFSALEY